MAVALLIAIASPRAVQAVTTAFVQVTNTPANAVPTMHAPAASQIYRGICGAFPAGNNSLQCSLASVPAGQTLFVETISLWVSTDAGVAPSGAQFYDGSYFVTVPMSAQANNSIGQASFSGTVAVRAAYPAGSYPACAVGLSGNSGGGGFQCAVYGYLAPTQ